MKETAPRTQRIAMLSNPAFSLHATFKAEAIAAANTMSVTVLPIELRSPQDIESAFRAVDTAKCDAMLILGQPFLVSEGPRLARLAIARRLPTMVPFEAMVRDGVLMSYASRLNDDVRRAAHYVDRILRGTNPAVLPVEQPSRFYLVINLRTASAIGLPISVSLRQRADDLIE